MSKKITTDVSIDLHVVGILNETEQQLGTTGLINCIIEYCCEQNDFTFPEELISALQEFIAGNS